MTKAEQIAQFLADLRAEGANAVQIEPGSDSEAKELFVDNFALICRKCGGTKIYLNWQEGVDYGGYTGYDAGTKIVKCISCGNAVSFWS